MEIGDRIEAALLEVAAALDRQTTWDREKQAENARIREISVQRSEDQIATSLADAAKTRELMAAQVEKMDELLALKRS
jgi:hypothetical protein